MFSLDSQLTVVDAKGSHINFHLIPKKNSDDVVMKYDEISILVDNNSMNFLNGSKLDFINDLLGSYFKVSNPNASSTCGCGTSFSV